MKDIKRKDELICFYLNLFNSLVVFACVQNTKEIPCTLYNWNKFLKYSYYQIGNMKLSLYDIKSSITKTYDLDDSGIHSKCMYLVDTRDFDNLKYCFCLPSSYTPDMIVYKSKDLVNQINMNMFNFLNRVITIKEKKVFIPVSIQKFLKINTTTNEFKKSLQK